MLHLHPPSARLANVPELQSLQLEIQTLRAVSNGRIDKLVNAVVGHLTGISMPLIVGRAA